MTVHDMHREVSIEIAADAATLYGLVSDLKKMAEWSPDNAGMEWQDGGKGSVGDKFVGHNRRGDFEWSVPCEVTVAERDKTYEWITRPEMGGCVRWTYSFETISSGTKVTEIWDVQRLPARLQDKTSQECAEIAVDREKAMRITLENLKAHAESES